MTPRETFMAIEALVWREEMQQKQLMAAAWHTAALMRQKRMPSLQRFLNPPKPARKLTGKELEKRRKQHREMTQRLDIDALGARLAKYQAQKAAR